MQALQWVRTAADAWRGDAVRIPGAVICVPGTRRIRLSVVAGNLRIHRLLERFVKPGAVVVDVGANIGYNTLHAARLAGPAGRVVAVEPTPDNVEVLRRNVAAAKLANVKIEPVAVGRSSGPADFYKRGEQSAVGSLFRESCYAHVTDVIRVRVVPLDELVPGTVDAVKIDVEGGELDVLEGMPRLLETPGVALIVEWHPLLQAMAGYAPDALPRWLLERGFSLEAAAHTSIRALPRADVERWTESLTRARRPVELVAQRPPR